jgi:hypothetical protein
MLVSRRHKHPKPSPRSQRTPPWKACNAALIHILEMGDKLMTSLVILMLWSSTVMANVGYLQMGCAIHLLADAL